MSSTIDENNLAECAADDHTDGHINRVTFDGERLKILEKCGFSHVLQFFLACALQK